MMNLAAVWELLEELLYLELTGTMITEKTVAVTIFNTYRFCRAQNANEGAAEQ